MIFERHNNFERLILIGMPCSGKTSIGKYLAQHYRLDFYDMDEEIVKAAGMSIQEIFEKKGEPAFRELETKTAISLSEKQNALIATGGGIVTRENNMQYFKKAGSLVVFIHRDFCKLATTPKRIMDKRPMLQKTSFHKLLNLYKTRLPLYRKYCDIEIHNDSNKDDAIREITRAIDHYSVRKEEQSDE